MQCFGERICRHAHRQQEVLTQHFARMNWPHPILDTHNHPPLVIIRHLDIFRSRRGPPKAEAPLIVNPDAVLALSIAFKGFQMIARR
jgi:hypothetical protein